jgi:hypothetical protein
MKNLKLYAFMVMLVVFVVAFLYNLKSLGCDKAAADFSVLECHKLYMSFGVLFSIGIMLLVSAGLYILSEPPEDKADIPAKNVFDSFAKQLIPIATLVLGYYFGSTTSSNTQGQSPAPNPSTSQESAPKN